MQGKKLQPEGTLGPGLSPGQPAGPGKLGIKQKTFLKIEGPLVTGFQVFIHHSFSLTPHQALFGLKGQYDVQVCRERPSRRELEVDQAHLGLWCGGVSSD